MTENVKIIIISVLAACCVLFLFLWLGSIGNQKELRATISSLEESNKRTKAEHKKLLETNRGLENTIEGLRESERERQEKYTQIKDNLSKELTESSKKLESLKKQFKGSWIWYLISGVVAGALGFFIGRSL